MQAAGLAAVLAGAPSGCGFTPLHGERSNASSAALAQFDIGIIADRTGQMLRNELLQRMDPHAAPPTGRPYVLKIKLTESRADLGIRIDESATRANLTLTAIYIVTGQDPNALPVGGSVSAVMSHNVLTSDYATLAARADARRRGVVQLADLLTERLSLWLVQTGGTFPLKKKTDETTSDKRRR